MNDKIKNLIVVCLFSVFVFGIFIFQVATPSKDISEEERRPLQQRPELSFKALTNGSFMTNFENYSMDQMPLRKGFRGAKSFCSKYLFMQKDNSGLYYDNGYISKLEYPINNDSIDKASNKFQYLYDKYLDGKNVNAYLSIIPDKNIFMDEDNKYLSINFKEFVSAFEEKNDYLKYIDIYDCLDISDYYRTDTHWRQECIVDVAQRLRSEMNAQPVTEYDVNTLEKPFYGVYYGQLALPVKPEKLNYLTNDTISACEVFDYETNKTTSVYDMELANGKDPYEIFLSGSKALLKISNPKADNDRRLVIFRDSFGSSLAPLMLDGYGEVVLIDIRYISSETLDNFVDFENSDVLFIYSSLVLNNSITFK